MTRTNTTPLNKYLSVGYNVNHEQQTLYIERKVESHFKIVSISGVNARQNQIFDNSTNKELLYISNIAKQELLSCHTEGFDTPNEIIKKSKYALSIRPGSQNRQIRRCKEYFDDEKPIYHASVRMYGMDNLNTKLHEKLCISGLRHSGIDKFILFRPMHIGKNGKSHFHIEYQGYFKPYWSVFYRSGGLSYHKFDDDRREYFNIDETNTKRIKGFHATTKYLLSLPSSSSYNYVKIGCKKE